LIDVRDIRRPIVLFPTKSQLTAGTVGEAMVGFGQLFPPENGVDTARLSELDLGPRPVRASCHLIMLVSAGQGSHALDFTTFPCRPGTLLWGRPGQVHHFGRQRGLDATLVGFAPAMLPEMPELAALRHLVDDPFAPTCWQPTGEDEEAIMADVAQISVDRARYGADRLGGALLAHELAVLLVRIAALAPQPVRGTSAELLAELRGLLEGDVVHKRVEEYAEKLECSVRTLTRASLAITGRSAKQLVDERIALEAKRLLATSDRPVAEVGRALGFDEPTNFGRFFMREVGQTPGGFRASAHVVPESELPVQRSALPGRLAPRS
jgi:AraC-like DNA-binding protein